MLKDTLGFILKNKLISSVCLTCLICLACLSLSGCFVYQPDIQQGNIFTEKKCEQIHKGMTKAQVEDILGSPVLQNTFTTQKLDYIYTLKPGHKKQTEKYLILTLKNNRVVNIEKKCS